MIDAIDGRQCSDVLEPKGSMEVHVLDPHWLCYHQFLSDGLVEESDQNKKKKPSFTIFPEI
jgi:hypothetical protein